MTREQAIRKFMVAKGMPNHPDWSGDFKDVGRFIDGLAALGLIMLDEPKTLAQKFRDLVMDARLVHGDTMQRLEGLNNALSDLGLKIVEK